MRIYSLYLRGWQTKCGIDTERIYYYDRSAFVVVIWMRVTHVAVYLMKQESGQETCFANQQQLRDLVMWS